MTMSPFALSLLQVETARQRQQDRIEGDVEVPAEVHQVPELRSTRPSRNRATSYYNGFQTICSTANDEPPSYDVAARQRVPQRPSNYLSEALPGYSCTVKKSAKVLINLESNSPLHEPTEGEWREAFLVVQGTLISFHRVKDNGPGKLLKSYTLQHAEVGLAPDVQHTVLVPQTRLAHLIPSGARRKTWSKDPDLFRAVQQHLLRLRVETDQVVVAHECEDQIHSVVTAISAGIDIAYAIDERSVPRQCTVPRRRRRQRASQTGDISDSNLVAEQERILRDMYPAFAEQAEEVRAPLERTTTNTSVDGAAESTPTPTREDDDLDLAAIREDIGGAEEPGRRPPMSRNTTSSSVNSTYSTDMMYATSPTNFGSDGKWQPPHTRTQQQVQRYVRRCMPVLLAEAVRASDILIVHGKRVRINWRMELLEEWELQPPTYKSHRFDDGLGLERTRSCSQNSASGSAQHDNAQTLTSDLCDDRITRAQCGRARLDLSKAAVLSTLDKGSPRVATAPKPQAPRHVGQDIHGVVFCF